MPFLPPGPVQTATPDFSKYTEIAPEEWLEGTVVSIMNYGAFVRLDGDVDGMVHVSQLDPHGERVDSVYNAVEVNCSYTVYAPSKQWICSASGISMVELAYLVASESWPCLPLLFLQSVGEVVGA